MKYVVPNTEYKLKNDCPFCLAISKLQNEILVMDNEHLSIADTKYINKIEQLEDLLIDGYSYIQQQEMLGILNGSAETNAMKNIDDAMLSRFKKYLPADTPFPTFTETDISNLPHTLYSRFCKRCSARKYDIYDTNRSERFDLLKPILEAEQIDNEIHLSWINAKSNMVAYAKLFRNEEELGKFDILTTEFADAIADNKLYVYQIKNYDKYDEELVSSNIYNAVNESEIPEPESCTYINVEQKQQIIDNTIKTFLYIDTEENCELYISRQPAATKSAMRIDNVIDISDMPFDSAPYYIIAVKYTELIYKHKNDGIISYRKYAEPYVYKFFIKPMLQPVAVQHVSSSDSCCQITWEEPEGPWLRTYVLVKPVDDQHKIIEFDRQYIVYTNEVRNKYKNESLTVSLINGKQYIIALFVEHQNGMVTLNVDQRIATPLYVVNPVYITKFDYNHYFSFINNEFVTDRRSVAWVTIADEPKYGGELSFQYNVLGKCKFRIFLDEILLYDKQVDKPFKDIHYINEKIEIPACSYKRLIFETYEMENTVFKMKDIKISFSAY